MLAEQEAKAFLHDRGVLVGDITLRGYGPGAVEQVLGDDHQVVGKAIPEFGTGDDKVAVQVAVGVSAILAVVKSDFPFI